MVWCCVEAVFKYSYIQLAVIARYHTRGVYLDQPECNGSRVTAGGVNACGRECNELL